jgi:hypothetical protein
MLITREWFSSSRRVWCPISSLLAHHPLSSNRGPWPFTLPLALTPVVVPSVGPFRLHLPAPLGSTGVTRLPGYYGCSDSCRDGLLRGRAGVSCLLSAPTRTAGLVGLGVARPVPPCPGDRVPKSGRSPLFTTTNRPPLPSPTTCCSTGSRVRVETSGLAACAGLATCTPPFQWDGASLGLRQSLAGSPEQPAESSSRKLRTRGSPGVALHLLS